MRLLAVVINQARAVPYPKRLCQALEAAPSLPLLKSDRVAAGIGVEVGFHIVDHINLVSQSLKAKRIGHSLVRAPMVVALHEGVADNDFQTCHGLFLLHGTWLVRGPVCSTGHSCAPNPKFCDSRACAECLADDSFQGLKQ